MKAVRGFIRFAISEGKLATDPTDGIKPTKGGMKSSGHMTWEPQMALYRGVVAQTVGL